MKPGRNDSCPCGSGKKYKHCCSNLSQTGMSAQPVPQAPTASDQNHLIALYKAGRYAELEGQASLFLKRHPDSGFGWKILSGALMAQGKNALHALQQTARLLPQDAEVLNNLGDALVRQGMQDEAETYLRLALKIKPEYPDALYNLACVLAQKGNSDEAAACHRKLLLARPDHVESHLALAQLNKAKTDDADLQALLTLEQDGQNGRVALSDDQRTQLHFALGKRLEDIGEFDRAFKHLLEGNRLKRKQFQYSLQADLLSFTTIQDIFNEKRIRQLSNSGNPSRLPVFIVGMPRSGTTLIEQIIASHPEAYGTGELPDLAAITRGHIAGVSFPDSWRQLEPDTLEAWAHQYLAVLQQHAPAAKRVTDKLPDNFLAIGLIHLMLPNAKIIHVRRDPKDTCISCFSNLFSQQNVKWSYDLSELGAFYAGYSELMGHWRQVLPSGSFLDVRYEDVIQDYENQARRLIDYCGLEWSDKCLEPHKNKRPIKTASFMQVRQPLYDSSIGRWRHFEEHLEPLLSMLSHIPTHDTGLLLQKNHT